MSCCIQNEDFFFAWERGNIIILLLLLLISFYNLVRYMVAWQNVFQKREIKCQHYFNVPCWTTYILPFVPPADGLSGEALKLPQFHLHIGYEFITYLMPGSQCCGHSIHGNSEAYNKSFYSNCTDSWLQMSEMTSLQGTSKRKSTILMPKPWPKLNRMCKKCSKMYLNKWKSHKILFLLGTSASEMKINEQFPGAESWSEVRL